MNEAYKRQLPLIGEEGQKKLAEAKVIIVGAGGIGNIAAKFLASCGVGYLEIYDYDNVEKSNLNRQLLFSQEDIGKNKARSLVNTLRKINPVIEYSANAVRFEKPYNVEAIDLVLDCSDNLETSYLLEELCLEEGIPLVFAKTSEFFGTVTKIEHKPFLKKGYPNKQLNEDHSVFPPIGGVIGSMQAALALKILLGLKIDDDVIHYDILNNYFRRIKKDEL